ncbi:Heparinase II/III family protein, partial [mine drainage metagenome]
PDYLPGHAHADTLSFELSLHGQRTLVNGGTATYEPGPERLRQRGTAAHNTVTVDGQDSSEVWSSFRVARRARPLDVAWGVDATGALWLAAAHDGYRRLPGHVTHRRRWEMDAKRLHVTDILEGRFADAQASFRFGPGAQLCPESNGAGEVVTDAWLMRWQVRGHRTLEAAPGSWHPRFGASEPCRMLVLSFSGATLETDFCWS